MNGRERSMPFPASRLGIEDFKQFVWTHIDATSHDTKYMQVTERAISGRRLGSPDSAYLDFTAL
jgi:hypothetical protein